MDCSIFVYIFAPERSAGSFGSVISRGLAEIQKDISQLVVEIANSDKFFVGYLAFTCTGSTSPRGCISSAHPSLCGWCGRRRSTRDSFSFR